MPQHEVLVSQNGSKGINWATLISAVGLLFVMVAAFWTIVQTSFSYIEKDRIASFAYVEKDKDIIRGQLVRTNEAFDARIVKLTEAIDARFLVLRGRLEGLIDKKVADEVFRQHTDRNVAEFETIKRQLQLLEQTRPTTGELKGTAESLTAGLQEAKERIRNLELRLIPQAAPLPK